MAFGGQRVTPRRWDLAKSCIQSLMVKCIWEMLVEPGLRSAPHATHQVLPWLQQKPGRFLLHNGLIERPWIFLGSISCRRQWVMYLQMPVTGLFSLCVCLARCPKEAWRNQEVFHQLCPEGICSGSWKSKLKQSIKPTM